MRRMHGIDRGAGGGAGTERPAGRWRNLGEVRARHEAAPPGTEQELVTVWPHLLYRELLALLLCLILLFAASIVFNAPLELPANPTDTPNPAKAPWYFVGLQELLVYFDPWMAGVVIPLVIILGLAAIPYLDGTRRGEGVYALRERPVAFIVFTAGLAAWFILIAVGSWMRGPGWQWIWPGQHGLDSAARETMRSFPNALGVPLFLAYWIGGGWLIARRARDWPGLTRGRRVLLAFLALAMTGTFLKVLLRLLLGVKYVVSFPGIGLNI
jgi:hypothetical protein